MIFWFIDLCCSFFSIYSVSLIFQASSSCRLNWQNYLVLFTTGFLFSPFHEELYFLLFLPIFYYLVQKKSFFQNKKFCYFYCLFPPLGFSLFSHSTAILISLVLPALNFEDCILLKNILATLLTTFMLFVFVHKFLFIHLDFFQKHAHELSQKWLFLYNVFLTFLCFSHFIYYWLEIHRTPKEIFKQNFILLGTLAFFLITFLLLHNKVRTSKHLIQQKNFENHLINLNAYIKKIEGLYQEVHAFRHDYKNILLSLKESFHTGDLQIIQSNYQKLLAKHQLSFEENIFYLTHVNYPPPSLRLEAGAS